MSFEAQYEGRCAAGDQVEPGDVVEYLDDRLVHSECVAIVRERDRASRREETREVCTTCWLLKPCGCDDERKTA